MGRTRTGVSRIRKGRVLAREKKLDLRCRAQAVVVGDGLDAASAGHRDVATLVAKVNSDDGHSGHDLRIAGKSFASTFSSDDVSYCEKGSAKARIRRLRISRPKRAKNESEGDAPKVAISNRLKQRQVRRRVLPPPLLPPEPISARDRVAASQWGPPARAHWPGHRGPSRIFLRLETSGFSSIFQHFPIFLAISWDVGRGGMGKRRFAGFFRL